MVRVVRSRISFSEFFPARASASQAAGIAGAVGELPLLTTSSGKISNALELILKVEEILSSRTSHHSIFGIKEHVFFFVDFKPALQFRVAFSSPVVCTYNDEVIIR